MTGTRTTSSGGYTGAGTTDLNAGALLTVWQNASSVYSGRFTGAGALAKGGSGTLTLTGANTATGGLTVRAGTVDTTGGGTLADTGAITISPAPPSLPVRPIPWELSAMPATIWSTPRRLSPPWAAPAAAPPPQCRPDRHRSGGQRRPHCRVRHPPGHHDRPDWGQPRRVTLANASDALALNRSGNSTYSGQLSGAGSVTKSGDGTLTLNKPGGFDVTSLIIDQGPWWHWTVHTFWPNGLA